VWEREFTPMKIVLVGSPGCGKSTLCPILHEKYNICHLHPTALLQDAATMVHHSAIASEARELLHRDAPAHHTAREALVMHLAVDAIKHRSDCSHGFVLDGLPKTEEQCLILDKANIVPDAVVVLDMPHDDVLRRLSGRWIHKPSRRIYHDVYCPPRILGEDDVTKEHLEQRPEDQKDSVMKRIAEYEEEVATLTNFYTQTAQSSSGDSASSNKGGQRKADKTPAFRHAARRHPPPMTTLCMGDAPLHHLYEALSGVLDPIFKKDQAHQLATSNGSWWSRLWNR
jgi:adenylate kinase